MQALADALLSFLLGSCAAYMPSPEHAEGGAATAF